MYPIHFTLSFLFFALSHSLHSSTFTSSLSSFSSYHFLAAGWLHTHTQHPNRWYEKSHFRYCQLSFKWDHIAFNSFSYLLYTFNIFFCHVSSFYSFRSLLVLHPGVRLIEDHELITGFMLFFVVVVDVQCFIGHNVWEVRTIYEIHSNNICVCVCMQCIRSCIIRETQNRAKCECPGERKM